MKKKLNDVENGKVDQEIRERQKGIGWNQRSAIGDWSPVTGLRGRSNSWAISWPKSASWWRIYPPRWPRSVWEKKKSRRSIKAPFVPFVSSNPMKFTVAANATIGFANFAWKKLKLAPRVGSISMTKRRLEIGLWKGFFPPQHQRFNSVRGGQKLVQHIVQ